VESRMVKVESNSLILMTAFDLPHSTI
jgi:hypothetical protein